MLWIFLRVPTTVFYNHFLSFSQNLYIKLQSLLQSYILQASSPPISSLLSPLFERCPLCFPICFPCHHRVLVLELKPDEGEFEPTPLFLASLDIEVSDSTHLLENAFYDIPSHHFLESIYENREQLPLFPLFVALQISSAAVHLLLMIPFLWFSFRSSSPLPITITLKSHIGSSKKFIIWGGSSPPLSQRSAATVCRPRHKGHADLMSSSPFSGLSSTVQLGFQTQRWKFSTRVALVAGL